jgi:hypothetical protein
MAEHDGNKEKMPPVALVGSAIAVGAGIGTVLMALSGNAVFIGIGAGVGLLVVLLWQWMT